MYFVYFEGSDYYFFQLFTQIITQMFRQKKNITASCNLTSNHFNMVRCIINKKR